MPLKKATFIFHTTVHAMLFSGSPLKPGHCVLNSRESRKKFG